MITPKVNTAPAEGQLREFISGIGGKLLGGLALGEVLKTGFEVNSDYQKGLAQLEAGLKSTGDAAGLTAEDMEKLADKISGYSGQSREGIVASEQLLETFVNVRNEAGKGNDIFTQATKITADLAARMGGDASSAAIKLGKALNDPIAGTSALSRIGVQFTQSQKDLIKSLVDSGNTLDAQKVILGELTTEFGGSAKAAGETLPGELHKAENTFKELTGEIVGAAAPALKLVVTGAEDIGKAFFGGIGFLKQHEDAVIGVTAAYAALKWEAIAGAIASFATAAGGLLETVALKGLYAADALRTLGGGSLIAGGLLGGVALGGVALLAVGIEKIFQNAKEALPAVQELTQAFTNNDTAAKTAAFIDALSGSSSGDNRRESVLEFLQRYKINIHDVYKAVSTGDTGAIDDLINKIGKLGNVQGDTNSKVQGSAKINADTYDQIIKVLRDLTDRYTSTAGAAKALASVHVELAQHLVGLPADYANISTAVDKLNAAGKPLIDTLSSQIDFFKGVADQSDITAAKLLKNAQDTVNAYLNESSNLAKLSAEGLSPDVIKGLVAQGPGYVAAAAQLSLSEIQKYGTLEVQAVQSKEQDKLAILKATEPQLYQEVVDAQNKAKQGVIDAYLNTLELPAKNALNAVQGIVSKAGTQIPDNMVSGLLKGKEGVLAAAIATFPAPIQKAVDQSIANIEAGKGPAISQAQAFADGINKETAKILTSLGITITTDDQASAKIQALQGIIGDLNSSAVKAGLGISGFDLSKLGGLADGGLFRGAGTGTSDSNLVRLSDYEYVMPAASVKQWGVGFFDAIRGYASGGLVRPAEKIFEQLNLEHVIGAVTPAVDIIAAGAGVGAGVSQWIPDVIKVLGLLSLPASLLPRVLAQIATESGGNAAAINLTDSNAAKGDPSMGVLQTIAETFRAYAGPFVGLGPFNGFADIFAGVNYAAHRYAGDPNIGLGYGHGYDNGGPLMPGWTMAYNGTGKPENVSSHDSMQTLVDEVRGLRAELATLDRNWLNVEHWHGDQTDANGLVSQVAMHHRASVLARRV